MMTNKERDARINSVHNLRRALWAKQGKATRTARKLDAFIGWFETTDHVKTAVKARISNLYNDHDAMGSLDEKLKKEEEKLYALPYTVPFKSYFDGETTLVISGMLPDCTASSRDEKEAMQMLALYYASEGNTEELPF